MARFSHSRYHLLLFVLILEHALVLLKFFLSWVVPDSPSWLVRAQARKEFQKERRAREEDALSTAGSQRTGEDDAASEAGVGTPRLRLSPRC